MKVRIFVFGSAALFAAWLGLTFVRDVPRDNYPVLGTAPLSAEVEVQIPGELPDQIVAEAAVVMD